MIGPLLRWLLGIVLLGGLWLGGPQTASGHGQLPGVLRIVEVAPDRYWVRLRTPPAAAWGPSSATDLSNAPASAGGSLSGPLPHFPAHCTRRPMSADVDSAASFELDCRRAASHAGAPSGLPGHPIAIDAGDANPAAELIVLFSSLDGHEQSALLRPQPGQDRVVLSAAAPPFAASVSFAASSLRTLAVRYLRLGIDHILDVRAGLDHVLFLLGLVLCLRRARTLLWAVSAFTVGHSLTLALAAWDVVRLPAPPVEALIALSIVYLAQRQLAPRPDDGVAAVAAAQDRAPAAMALGFGLLHGLGFASALSDVGLPTGGRVPALLCFNLGVEIGQLAWICIFVPPVAWWRRHSDRAPALRRLPAYALGSVAAALAIARLVDVFSPRG